MIDNLTAVCRELRYLPQGLSCRVDGLQHGRYKLLHISVMCNWLYGRFQCARPTCGPPSDVQTQVGRFICLCKFCLYLSAWISFTTCLLVACLCVLPFTPFCSLLMVSKYRLMSAVWLTATAGFSQVLKIYGYSFVQGEFESIVEYFSRKLVAIWQTNY